MGRQEQRDDATRRAWLKGPGQAPGDASIAIHTAATAPGDEEGSLVRRVLETGGPGSPTFTRRTLGGAASARVLRATGQDQLGGRVEQRWPPEGLECDLAIPPERNGAA